LSPLIPDIFTKRSRPQFDPGIGRLAGVMAGAARGIDSLQLAVGPVGLMASHGAAEYTKSF